MRGIKHWAVAIIALIAMIVGFTSYQPVPTAAASKDRRRRYFHVQANR